MNVEHAMRDPRLLGGLPCFHNLDTWAPWLSFIRALYGYPMSLEDLERFRRHTGRQEPRPDGYPEGVVIVGVQCGKSQIATSIVNCAAIDGAPGTQAVLVSQDHRGSMRVLLRYTRQPFETIEAFKGELVRATADTLELRNGVSIAALPCRPATLRGVKACVVVLDEFAFFISTDGRPVDQEMLRVARGRVATTGGKIVILSSPYAQTGALHELHRKHYGREDSPVLVWQASAPEMNPTLPPDYLARMEQDDPEAFRSEVLGEFRTGISTLFDPDALAACVPAGVRERLRDPACSYFSFSDPASGSGKDAFGVAIAHRDGERAVLDVVRTWKPPFNPSSVLAEAAALLKSFGLRETTGDRYAPGFVSEGFLLNGITYIQSERDRSAIYLDMLPRVNAGAVQLLDDAELLRELRGLERRRGTGGRDRADHRPGSHDDRANSACGALLLASAPEPAGGMMIDRFTGEVLTREDMGYLKSSNSGVFPCR